MPKTETHAIQIEKFLNAPISQIYQLLSNEEYLNLYIEGSTFDPFEGGKYSLFDNRVRGDVLELKNNQRIKLTWLTKDWEVGTPASVVTITFENSPKGTLLKLKHENLPSKKEADAHMSGWEKFVFTPLEEFLKL